MGFHHVDQDVLALLTSLSTHLSLQKCRNYRLKPLRPAVYQFFIMAGENNILFNFSPPGS